jgi:transposase
MRSYLEQQAEWLTVERLPAYAPELNPSEGLWANLKGRELANRCDLEIAATVAAAEAGIQRVRSNQQLLFGFLCQTGLSL